MYFVATQSHLASKSKYFLLPLQRKQRHRPINSIFLNDRTLRDLFIDIAKDKFQVLAITVLVIARG